MSLSNTLSKRSKSGEWFRSNSTIEPAETSSDATITAHSRAENGSDHSNRLLSVACCSSTARGPTTCRLTSVCF